MVYRAKWEIEQKLIVKEGIEVNLLYRGSGKQLLSPKREQWLRLS
jgi:hypothetical protein